MSFFRDLGISSILYKVNFCHISVLIGLIFSSKQFLEKMFLEYM